MNGIIVMIMIIITSQTEGSECSRVGRRTPCHLKGLSSLGNPFVAILVWVPPGKQTAIESQVIVMISPPRETSIFALKGDKDRALYPPAGFPHEFSK